MITFSARALAALLMAALPFAASAQTPAWLQSRPYATRFSTDYLRTDAAALPDGGAWWLVPDQHRGLSSGLAETASLRLQRLTAAGVVRSSRLIEGNVALQNIVAAPDGGLVLTGAYADSVVFDPQHRLTERNFMANEQSFVARLDSAGRVQWLRRLRTADPLMPITSQGTPAFDAQGNLWVPNDNYHHSYLTRFSPTGDSLQSIEQRDVNRITSVAIAPDGTIYAAGSCPAHGATFAGQPGPQPFSYTLYVVCYSASGQFQWVRYVEDITCPAPLVATNDNDGVYFSSALFTPVAFGSITANGPGFNSDFFLTRLDRATGTFQWVREVPQVTTGNAEVAHVKSLTVDAAGNAWLLLRQQGVVAWNAALTTDVRTSAWVYTGVLVQAYDALGNLRTAMTSRGTFAHGHGLSIDRQTNRGVLTGLSIDGSGSFGTLPLPVGQAGTSYPFVVGFDASLMPLGAAAEAVGSTSAVLFPNPVAAGADLTLRDLPAGTIAATLVDAAGRTVVQTALNVRAAGEEVRLTLPADLSAGLYALRCQTPAGLTTRRVAVSR